MKTLEHFQGVEDLGVLLLFMGHNDMMTYLILLDKLQTISRSGSMTVLCESDSVVSNSATAWNIRSI